MTSIDSAARLRRIAFCARTGQPIDPADGLPFADGVDAWWAGHAPLDQALGLNAAGRGKPDARRALLIDERETALREMAEHFGGPVDSADGEGIHEIAECLAEFARWRWPDMRAAAICPANLVGTDALAWQILRSLGGKAPTRRWLADFFRS
ncbi:MAG: hypothetical protein EOR67_16120 [Mesorhizobium sp.]|uniref:hypothetical protein n=1 Tax=Mesorhizobium sp. TaxID=1871066 RepID=UPI000FE668AE|nr:hypothetical protein [Mesorhizobium sp.]RWL87723.1 MAG: hypothetical protein EOR67_16120 [Mesorhizobium sp.]